MTEVPRSERSGGGGTVSALFSFVYLPAPKDGRPVTRPGLTDSRSPGAVPPASLPDLRTNSYRSGRSCVPGLQDKSLALSLRFRPDRGGGQECHS